MCIVWFLHEAPLTASVLIVGMATPTRGQHCSLGHGFRITHAVVLSEPGCFPARRRKHAKRHAELHALRLLRLDRKLSYAHDCDFAELRL